MITREGVEALGAVGSEIPCDRIRPFVCFVRTVGVIGWPVRQSSIELGVVLLVETAVLDAEQRIEWEGALMHHRGERRPVKKSLRSVRR